MKITKQTVKTIVNITLDSADVAHIIDRYKNSDGLKAAFSKAFENMSVTAEMPEENVLKVMNELFVHGNKDTFDVFAKVCGFDGWENAGYLDKDKMVYKMVVFNYGDTVNG